MKVLHLSSEKGWRGGERQIIFLIDALLKQNIAGALFCRENSELHIYCRQNNITHFTAPFRNSFDIETATMIKKCASTENFDILHFHTPKAQTLGVIAGILGLKKPMVLTKRTSFNIKKNFLTLYKYNYHGINKIIAISERIAVQLQEVVKCKEKITTIYSSIDFINYQTQSKNILHNILQLSPETKLIGIVAALSSEKDHHTFIKMAEVLLRKNEEVHFVIIGKGPLEKQLISEIEDRKLKQNIHLIGHQKDIYSLFPELEVLLLTSKEEGLGSVILDAFASKVPVVATNAGGIPELVIHKKTGLLAPIGDFNALAENVEMILADDSLKRCLIQNAFEFVQNFSKEMISEKIIAVYDEALGT